MEGWRCILPKPRKRIRPISKAGRARQAEYKKVRQDWLMARAEHISDDMYVLCDAPACKEWQLIDEITIHHTRGRVGSLLCDTRHWRALCLKCHRDVGNNPAWARQVGLLCEKGLWNTPDRT